MATRTLPFDVNTKGVHITLFLFIYIDLLRCQQFVVPFKAPSDCGVEEFFDISRLSCVRCGSNQQRSTTGRLLHDVSYCSDITLTMESAVKLVLFNSYFILRSLSAASINWVTVAAYTRLLQPVSHHRTDLFRVILYYTISTSLHGAFTLLHLLL